QAFLSGGVVIHQFCRIGRLAMIGGNSKIIQDCLPFVVTDGVPGRAAGLNSIGLRRAGVSGTDMRALKEAYRVCCDLNCRSTRRSRDCARATTNWSMSL